MIADTLPYQSFWSSAWAAPLRRACHWLQREAAPDVPSVPDALAPGWLRPLCVQRLIGQAIAARLKRMRTHPDQTLFLFPEQAIPLWTPLAWEPYQPRTLHAGSNDWLTTQVLLEVERLLRILQVPPSLMGQEVWTHAALGACERLAQLYHEFRRRFNARRVRRFFRQALLEYIYWEPASEPPAVEEMSGPTD